jgi:hypothetical protein
MNRSRKWKKPSSHEKWRRRAIRNLRKMIAYKPINLPEGAVADENPDLELMLIALETEDDFPEQQRRLDAFVEKHTRRRKWYEILFEILFPNTASNWYIRP